MYVSSRNIKISEFFYLNFFRFLEVKFSIYLNRHVFVIMYMREFSLSNRCRLGCAVCKNLQIARNTGLEVTISSYANYRQSANRKKHRFGSDDFLICKL